MVASGMGMINNNDITSELKIASIRMLTKSECEKLFENTWTFYYRGRRLDYNNFDSQFLYSDGIICGKDVTNTCKGDSGGPVVANIEGRFTLVGITSFGLPNTCSSNTVGYYTDVSYYRNLDFIHSVN